MEWSEATTDIKLDFERQVEAIERGLAHCDSYSWEVARRRQTLEEERQKLLMSLESLQESDRIYGGSEHQQY